MDWTNAFNVHAYKAHIFSFDKTYMYSLSHNFFATCESQDNIIENKAIWLAFLADIIYRV